jgi:hypothetical protein
MIPWKQRRVVPEWLLCIDPGGIMGWALFHRGRLVACGYGPHDRIIDEELLPRGVRKVTVLFEIPIAYPGPKSKTDPNDLIRTGIRVGEFKQKFRVRGFTIEECYPNEWKGNIPKPEKASEPYVITDRVLEKLDEGELKLLYESKSARATKLDYNLSDATGMGLWRCRRWKTQ